MTHEELLAKIDEMDGILVYPDGLVEGMGRGDKALLALRAVVELHKPKGELDWAECDLCDVSYPCPTIQAIEKELS